MANTRLRAFLCLLALSMLAVPAVADEVDDLILDLKYGSDVVRRDATVALGEMGDPRAIDPLIEALKDDDHWRVRGNAAWALGKIGDVGAVDSLIEGLKDENSAVRYEAAGALGEIGDVRAVEPLVTALGDDGPLYIRKNAVDSLGKIGDPKAVGPLLVLMQETDLATDSLFALMREKYGLIDVRLMSDGERRLIVDYREIKEKISKALVAIGVPAVEP